MPFTQLPTVPGNTFQFANPVDMGNLNIQNLADAVAAKDAVNKQFMQQYVNAAIGSGAIRLISTPDGEVSEPNLFYISTAPSLLTFSIQIQYMAKQTFEFGGANAAGWVLTLPANAKLIFGGPAVSATSISSTTGFESVKLIVVEVTGSGSAESVTFLVHNANGQLNYTTA